MVMCTCMQIEELGSQLSAQQHQAMCMAAESNALRAQAARTTNLQTALTAAQQEACTAQQDAHALKLQTDSAQADLAAANAKVSGLAFSIMQPFARQFCLHKPRQTLQD